MPKSIKVQNIDTKVSGSHKDIFPTLYNQTLSNTTYISVGKNLLNKSTRHCGFNDKGIIISDAGDFYHNKYINKIQNECNKEYNSALAISDWLIRVYPKNINKGYK
jgi:hypothetical protein